MNSTKDKNGKGWQTDNKRKLLENPAKEIRKKIVSYSTGKYLDLQLSARLA